MRPSPEVAAIMILGHLDRAQPYMREYGIYPALEWVSHAGSVLTHVRPRMMRTARPKNLSAMKAAKSGRAGQLGAKASGSASQGFPGRQTPSVMTTSQSASANRFRSRSPKAFRSILSLLSLWSFRRARILSIQLNVLLCYPGSCAQI